MVCENTLRVKNLPKELSDAEKEDLLRHFGAQKVKIVSSSYKESCIAFAQFESKEIAKSVLLRLHQIKVLNSRLCVEFAEHEIIDGRLDTKHVDTLENNDQKHYKAFINKLNAFNSAVSFHQPVPNHLKYAYPKPNRATINNIAHALASVPKFYTQVLHLMNKMNLPPPFSNVPDPPQVSLRQVPTITQVSKLTPRENSSESEMESDPEDESRKEIIPIKRKIAQKKCIKRPKFMKPSTITPTTTTRTVDKTDDVFERVDIQQRKELKFSSDILESKMCNPIEPDEIGSIGMMGESEKVEDDEQSKTVISEKELETNRIPLKDLNVLPIFKDYHPGAPTCRLYIKNIAKTVEVKDLEYVYRRYLEEDLEKPSQFDIRLMQEGRMKGQAFVTLDSVQLAQKAVNETNGFILKDKPLVVVFAKSVVSKK